MNKKNLGLIALFILLIAAVVLLTAGETREEDAPLPDIRLTEIVPHSTQINADGYAMGSITLTSFADAPADLTGWGLADRVYKVKYVFERGTTLGPGESLTVYLAGKHGAKGTLRYASFGLSCEDEEHVYLYAADGRTSDEIELPALGHGTARIAAWTGSGRWSCPLWPGASGGRNLSLYNGESQVL